MLIIDLDNKIHRKNTMKHISGKAALLALSMISATAYASHWSYQEKAHRNTGANWTRRTRRVKAECISRRST